MKKTRNLTQDRNRAFTKVVNYKERMRIVNAARSDLAHMSIREVAEKYDMSTRTIKYYSSNKYVENLQVPTDKEFELYRDKLRRMKEKGA